MLAFLDSFHLTNECCVIIKGIHATGSGDDTVRGMGCGRARERERRQNGWKCLEVRSTRKERRSI